MAPGTLIIANVPLPPAVYRELRNQAAKVNIKSGAIDGGDFLSERLETRSAVSICRDDTVLVPSRGAETQQWKRLANLSQVWKSFVSALRRVRGHANSGDRGGGRAGARRDAIDFCVNAGRSWRDFVAISPDLRVGRFGARR